MTANLQELATLVLFCTQTTNDNMKENITELIRFLYQPIIDRAVHRFFDNIWFSKHNHNMKILIKYMSMGYIILNCPVT